MQIRNDSQPATFVKYEGQVPDGIAKKKLKAPGLISEKTLCPVPGV